jgi:hypothetical protein
VGLGKVDPGGRGVENARACEGAEVQVAHVQGGMVSSETALVWAPVADPKRGVRDWDFGWATDRGAVSLASTILPEMHHDADWNPATHPVLPRVRRAQGASSPAPRGNGLWTGTASARTMSRRCRIVGGACSTLGLVYSEKN